MVGEAELVICKPIPLSSLEIEDSQFYLRRYVLYALMVNYFVTFSLLAAISTISTERNRQIFF